MSEMLGTILIIFGLIFVFYIGVFIGAWWVCRGQRIRELEKYYEMVEGLYKPEMEIRTAINNVMQFRRK